MDAQEYVELSKSIVRKNIPSEQIPKYMVEKSSSSEGAATSMDDVVGSKTDPARGSSRSTFLAQRECWFL